MIRKNDLRKAQNDPEVNGAVYSTGSDEAGLDFSIFRRRSQGSFQETPNSRRSEWIVEDCRVRWARRSLRELCHPPALDTVQHVSG